MDFMIVSSTKGSGMDLFSIYLCWLAQKQFKKPLYLDFEVGDYNRLDRIKFLQEVKHFTSKPRKV